MRAAAHPVGIRAEIHVRGLGAQFAQEFALVLSFGGGMRSGCGIVSPRGLSSWD